MEAGPDEMGRNESFSLCSAGTGKSHRFRVWMNADTLKLTELQM